MNQKGFVQVFFILLLLIGIGVGVYLIQFTQVFTPKASTITVPKQIFANFYWYYPWYGAHFKNEAGQYQFVENQNGYIGLQAFRWKPLDPIPYINSSERTFGDNDDSRAKIWFKGSFERAGAAGLTSLAVMARPDLEKWPVALTQMIESVKELKAAGKPFPKILLHYDGVDFWDKQSPGTGQLTGPGQDYDVIWKGTKSTFDTIYSLVSPQELPEYFVTYPDSSTLAILVYRIEGTSENFTSSDWWTTQLRADFTRTYPGKNIYLILDDLWCNWDYGVNNSVHTKTCNGDNYYRYGGSWAGAIKSTQAQTPVIYSVGPGFDNDMSSPQDGLPPIYRENGQFYQKNLDLAKNGGADWIHIETFNFGEEGSGIDRTQEFGSQYLDLTKTFSSQFLTDSSGCPGLIAGTFITSPSSNGTAFLLKSDNKKYWIANPADYVKLGGKSDFSDLNNISAICIAKYPDGGQANPNVAPSPTTNKKIGDIDGDGDVDIFDFNLFIPDMKNKNLRSDINGDGKVDIFDFNSLIGNFGK